MIRVALMTSFVALSMCTDETLTGYGAADATWQLDTLDGAEVAGRVTIAFPEPGRLTGQAQCNRYNAAQSAPYPWFEAGPIQSTRMACPNLDAEQTYLTALSEMTIAEVSGDTLILSNDAGRNLVFKAR